MTAFQRPFRYDPEGVFILDANNQVVLEVRGWGYLTGKGAGGLKKTRQEAIQIQDEFGKRISELLNKETDDR